MLAVQTWFTTSVISLDVDCRREIRVSETKTQLRQRHYHPLWQKYCLSITLYDRDNLARIRRV